MIGYAIFDIENFKEWNKSYQPIRHDMADEGWVSDHWQEYFYERQEMYHDCKNVMDKHSFERADTKELEALINHLSDIGEKLWLFSYDDTACIIGYEKERFVMNSDFVTPEYLRDYSKLTVSEMNRLAGTVSENNLLPSYMGLNNSSVESLSDKKKVAQTQLEDAKAEIRAKEDAIREEMYKRIEAMKAEMAEKLNDLNAKVEQYQKEIFVLESQIFSIRCYTGEVVKFHQIKGGRAAEEDTPLILYQKIRFLDEELGKHVSIFDFDGEEDKRLIPLLRAREDIAQLLAPKGRSLTILRTSRTGKFVAANEDVKNMLTEYDQYHGMQLALLLRDSERLYIAWCDADNITINEENAFYSVNQKTEIVAENENAAIRDKETNIHEALSRYYLLAILQGMIDNGGILRFPEHVNVMASPYVIFSLAEGWVDVNKYGTFADMLEKSKDIAPKKGDNILTVTRLCSESKGRSFENDRGVGYANRTYGVRLSGKKLYPINVIYDDAVVEYEYEALKINEYMGTKDILCTRNGVTTKEKEPEVKYDVTDEVLFAGKGRLTIGFETYRNMKDEDLKKQVEIDLSAVDNAVYSPDMYYMDGNAERRYHRPDSFNRKATLSEKTLYAKRITAVKIVEKIPHIFVSVEQTGEGSYKNNWKSTTYHVNFEVLDGEYINTAFLCSSWMKEVIRSGKTGYIRFPGATPSFADLLPYFHIIKQELEEKERKEKELIIDAGGNEFIAATDDWDVALCEWKIRNEIHELTPTRAKRFVKEISNE